MKNVLFSVVAFSLLNQSISLGRSKEEWRKTLDPVVHLVLSSHFTALHLDHFSVLLASHSKLREGTQSAFFLSKEIHVLDAPREGGEGLSLQRLYDLEVYRRQFEYLGREMQYQHSLVSRNISVWDAQCSRSRMNSIGRDFNAHGQLAIAENLRNMISEFDKASRTPSTGQTSIPLRVRVWSPEGFGVYAIPSLYSGSGDTQSILGFTATLGTGLGSFFPGASTLGASLGAAIGFFGMGALLHFLGGSPTARAAETLHKEIDNLLGAVQEMNWAWVAEVAEFHCMRRFDSGLGKEVRQLFTEDSNRRWNAVVDLQVRSEKTASQIARDHADALRELPAELPFLALRVEESLTRYWKERRELAKESKAHFSETARAFDRALEESPLSASGVSLRQQAWDLWLRGDARFRSSGEFSFLQDSTHSKDLLYWNVATPALLRNLRERGDRVK